NSFSEAVSIASQGCPIRLTTNLYFHVTRAHLMHTVGHLLNEPEKIEKLLVDGRRAGGELRDFTALVNQRDHARIRLLCLLDHLALPFGQRGSRVPLEHAQVSANH